MLEYRISARKGLPGEVGWGVRSCCTWNLQKRRNLVVQHLISHVCRFLGVENVPNDCLLWTLKSRQDQVRAVGG